MRTDKATERLMRAMKKSVPPCDTGCPHRDHCTQERKACQRFVRFTNTGHSLLELKNKPTRFHYLAVFPPAGHEYPMGTHGFGA